MMKALLILIVSLCAMTAHAQVPATTARRDSVPTEVAPNAVPMPTIRSANSFYRKPNDPKNVVRATLDNMPVKLPDSSITYTMPRSGSYKRPQPRKPHK